MIDNAVFKIVKVAWEDMVFPVNACTPVDAYGNVANNENAIGIIPATISEKPISGTVRVCVGGDVCRPAAEKEYGQAYTDEAVTAMSNIRWYGGKEVKSGGGGMQILMAQGTKTTDGDWTAFEEVNVTINMTYEEVVKYIQESPAPLALVHINRREVTGDDCPEYGYVMGNASVDSYSGYARFSLATKTGSGGELGGPAIYIAPNGTAYFTYNEY